VTLAFPRRGFSLLSVGASAEVLSVERRSRGIVLIRAPVLRSSTQEILTSASGIVLIWFWVYALHHIVKFNSRAYLSGFSLVISKYFGDISIKLLVWKFLLAVWLWLSTCSWKGWFICWFCPFFFSELLSFQFHDLDRSSGHAWALSHQWFLLERQFHHNFVYQYTL
jgi:hypothetical protein